MTTRPTPEQRTTYEAAWEAYALNTADGAIRTILRIADTTPDISAFLKEQFVAACFLEDHLREMDTTADYRKDQCFTFGRMCVGTKDVWAVFDKMLTYCQETHRLLQERAARFSTPATQDVPSPTKLLTGWWGHAKNSRGDRGVYPQVFFHRDEADAWTIEALALNGKEAFEHAISVVRSKQPVEFVLGVDMSALPGQDLAFDDFLAVIWGLGDDLYSGIVEYQPLGSVADPAFRPVRWDNNYWNHAIREDYFPKFRRNPA